MALERLQKIMAAAGIASRRKAEEMIQAGLVSVNGNVVTELGSKADPDTDSIRVNNKLLQGAERHEYIALNKPRGYVTTVSDPEGRATVMELLRSKARLYPIGRLDFNSEGLLLLTNDGGLAHKLMKAASHIPKTYLVKVAGQPGEDQLRRLRAGVSIAEERDPSRRIRTAPAQIRVIKEADNPWLEVTLHEGRNRQIRKMFEEIGHHVEKIRRVRYGPLELDLPPGESRPLTAQEVSRLRQATNLEVSRLKVDQGSRGLREDRRPPRRDSRSEKQGREREPRHERREPRFGFADRPRHESQRQGARADNRFDRGQRSRKPSRSDDRFPRAGEGERDSRSFRRPHKVRDAQKSRTDARAEGQDRDRRGSLAGRPRRDKPEARTQTRQRTSDQRFHSGRRKNERNRVPGSSNRGAAGRGNRHDRS